MRPPRSSYKYISDNQAISHQHWYTISSLIVMSKLMQPLSWVMIITCSCILEHDPDDTPSYRIVQKILQREFRNHSMNKICCCQDPAVERSAHGVTTQFWS